MNTHPAGRGRFINSDHPAIVKQANTLVRNIAGEKHKAVALYYWTRDAIRYNPYSVSAQPEDYLASTILAAGESWCVPKALVLAALCRAVGLDARVGFADVRNHLSTERMRQMMETDLFYFHGYTSIRIDGHWLKATPAFNVELCDRFGLLPLEFDGTADSLYHPFDRAGNRHMEYVNERGEFQDLPFDDMMAVFTTHYPAMMQALGERSLNTEQWEADVGEELR